MTKNQDVTIITSNGDKTKNLYVSIQAYLKYLMNITSMKENLPPIQNIKTGLTLK